MDLAERAPHVGLAEQVPGTGPGGQPIVEPAHATGGAEHDAFVVELGGDQPPALVLLADEHLDRDAHVAVVGGVDVMRAVAGDDGRPAEAGILGVHDEDRDAAMPRVGAAGANREPDVVGVVAAGGEDLLPVHHIVVAVAHGRGAQRREVGSGVGLGIADREVHLPREDGGQELPLLFLRPVDLQGRPDGLQGDAGQRHVGAHGFVDEDLLLDLTEAAAAEFDGPADSEPAVLAHPAHDLPIGGSVALGAHDRGFLGRDQICEVPSQFRLQRALLVGQVDEHRAPTRSSRYEAPPSRRARSFAVEE